MELPKARTNEIVRNISSQFNDKTTDRHYTNEVQFSFHNHREILAAFESGQAVDLGDLPKRPGISALLVGSGPTLDGALPTIKDWPGDIVCSTSQASTLIGWGREPEHIVALDPDCNPAEFDADTWEGRKSILHLHPGVMPDLVRWWKGPMAFFRKLQPQNGFYGNEQCMGYSPLGPLENGRYQGNKTTPLIRSQVPMLACALAAQICIAKHLGYRQLVLVGGDFSYPGDQERFTRRSWNGSEWVDIPPAPLESCYGREDDPIVETEIDGLKSSGVQIFYAHQSVVAWRLTETDIVNAFPAGLMRMMPTRPWEEILRRGNKGVKGFNLKQIIEASEEHLAKQNIFILYVGGGIMPHEFQDPLHEIPKALGQMKQMLKAQGKADQVDVEANMKRMRKLFDKVLDAS